jgi:hypothetical protein
MAYLLESAFYELFHPDSNCTFCNEDKADVGHLNYSVEKEADDPE